jgi:hypothetical protein
MGRSHRVSEVSPALERLESLNSLRRRAAHRASYDKREPPLKLPDAENARRLTYAIIEQLVES